MQSYTWWFCRNSMGFLQNHHVFCWKKCKK